MTESMLPATRTRTARPERILMTTSDEIPGRTIVETIGLVHGNSIRSRHIGRDIMAALKGLVGGEIDEYTKMLAEAREQVLDRMSEDARAMGADAVVAMRFNTNSMMQGAAELLAYGTAVRLSD